MRKYFGGFSCVLLSSFLCCLPLTAQALGISPARRRRRLAVQSIHHFINHGGSEMVVYRVSQDAASGVRVGDNEYAGFLATGAGIKGAPADLRVAFFAVLWDQDPSTPIPFCPKIRMALLPGGLDAQHL